MKGNGRNWLVVAMTFAIITGSHFVLSADDSTPYYPLLWEESRNRITSFRSLYDVYQFTPIMLEGLKDDEIHKRSVQLVKKLQDQRIMANSVYDVSNTFEMEVFAGRYSLEFSPPKFRELEELLFSNDPWATVMNATWYNGEHFVDAYCPRSAPKTISEVCVQPGDSFEFKHAVDIFASGMYDKMWAGFPRIKLKEEEYNQLVDSDNDGITVTLSRKIDSSPARRVFKLLPDNGFVCPLEKWFNSNNDLEYFRLSSDFEIVDRSLPPFPLRMIRWTGSNLTVYVFRQVELNPSIDEDVFSVGLLPGYDFSEASVEDKYGVDYDWAEIFEWNKQ